MRMDVNILSEISNIRKVETVIDEISTSYRIGSDAYGKILVATIEAVNNAIIHGNRTNNKKAVNVGFEVEGKDLIITVRDEGKGFNPETVPDPTAPENIENIHGRGVFLMKRLSDDISFNRNGTMVKMKFNIV